MQFLETAASALNKVDKLAAEVIPKRARFEDAGEDALEVNPDAVDTAAAIEALAAKLGMTPTPDTDDAATAEGDASPETRARLAALLADLRAGEATAREAAARRDHALALAADEQAVRDREALNASQALRSIERELAAEKAAHAATRAQAEDRERALTSDASEYDDMLAAVRRQTREKLEEATRLEARAAAAEAAEPELRAEAEAAEARLADARARANATTARARARADADPLADADGNAAKAKAAEAAAASRASELRDALAAARADAAALAAEESARRAADARRPSRASADRLADLERRLAETATQLEEKRARTATLAAEKAALEKSLADALMERRKVRERAAGGSDGDPGVGSSATRGGAGGAGGLKRRAGAGWGGGPPDAGDADDRGASLTGLRVRSRAASAARRVDALSVEAGKRLRRSGGWRSAVILYVLGLHGLAFVVLAYRALGSAPKP